uniref:Uncharacterized protein n=1 Tax=Arundo donax TaxID=35708 RepID=A0A0A9BTZ6_ARUDO
MDSPGRCQRRSPRFQRSAGLI